MTLSDFRSLKNVCVKTQQNNVTETTQKTLCLMFESFYVLEMSFSASFHIFSRSEKLLTASLI